MRMSEKTRVYLGIFLPNLINLGEIIISRGV